MTTTARDGRTTEPEELLQLALGPLLVATPTDGGTFRFGDATDKDSLGGLGVSVDDVVGALPAGARAAASSGRPEPRSAVSSGFLRSWPGQGGKFVNFDPDGPINRICIPIPQLPSSLTWT
jgi:hypothetical protein